MMRTTSTLLGASLGLAVAFTQAPAAAQTPPAAAPNKAPAPAATGGNKAPAPDANKAPATPAPAADANKAPATPAPAADANKAPATPAPAADANKAPGTPPPAAGANKGPLPAGDSKALFDAGSKAYQAGDFKAAIQAFEQAYKIDERPGLLFSIAQAHRRQYAVDRRAGHIAIAIKYFRDYVVTVQQGGRRADAVQALNELEPIAQQLQRDGQLQPLEDQAPSTRLVVSSPTAEATLTLDGEKEARPLPFIGEVTPGKHTFKIAREGFATEERTVEVASGGVTALDIGLNELPARVDIKGPVGASAWVDGRPSGRLPLSGPVEVPAGRHDVRVSLPGYEEHREEVELSRGGSQSVTASLRLTLQRKLALGFAGTGALSLVTGAILGGVALAEQASASSIKADIDAGKVVCRTGLCPRLDDYNRAVDARNALGGASGALLGTGALFAASGVLLYLFDAPAPILPVRPSESAPKAPAPKGDAPSDLGFTPVVGPGFAGGTMQFRF